MNSNSSLCHVLRILFCITLFSSVICRQSSQHPRRWGTFRPAALFGLRVNAPDSPLVSIAWSSHESLSDLRHDAGESSDKHKIEFTYLRHNGRSYAQERIIDKKLNLEMNFDWVQHSSNHAWTLRVSGNPIQKSLSQKRPISLILFSSVGTDELPINQTGGVEHQYRDSITLKDLPSSRGLLGSAIISGSSLSLQREGSAAARFQLHYLEPRVGSIPRSERLFRRVRNVLPDDELMLIDDSVLSDLIPFMILEEARPQVDLSRCHYAALSLPLHQHHRAHQLVTKSKKAHGFKSSLKDGGLLVQSNTLENEVTSALDAQSNVFALQRVMSVPFEVDIVFFDEFFDGFSQGFTHESEIDSVVQSLSGSAVDQVIQSARRKMDERVSQVFDFKKTSNDFSVQHTHFARETLSNLLGGIAYLNGRSLVARNDAMKANTSLGADEFVLIPSNFEYYTDLPRSSELGALRKTKLLTATPSRSVFPRGFLWDEGFHQLVIMKWDLPLALECLESWLSGSMKSGWIPREQVLGSEARSQFADHIMQYMLQNPDIANPPTLLMPWSVMSTMEQKQLSSVDFLAIDKWKSMFETLERHVLWLDSTQRASNIDSYRWRGRSLALAPGGGVPLTLASGLDDYPRSKVPHDEERHLDLHCWMIWAFEVLERLAVTLSRMSLAKVNEFGNKVVAYRDRANHLRGSLNSAFADGETARVLCDYDGAQQRAVCHEGYVMLFPLILGILPEDSSRVGDLLAMISDPKRLNSTAGIRSLSAHDLYYGKGDKYWTGPVWIPINYLLLGSLHSKYARNPGPFQLLAREVYRNLRSALVSNMFREWRKSGTVFEQYSDNNGNGQRGKHFTGWSALIVLIMAEDYTGVI